MDPHRTGRQEHPFATPGNICPMAQQLKECLAKDERVWAYAFELACPKQTSIIA